MPSAAGLERTSTHSIEQVERRVQSESRSKRSRDRRTEIISPILATVLLLVAWEVAADFFNIPTYLFPAPSKIIAACIDNASLLLRESWVTSVEIVLGYILSIVIGIPLASEFFTGRSLRNRYIRCWCPPRR